MGHAAAAVLSQQTAAVMTRAVNGQDVEQRRTDPGHVTRRLLVNFLFDRRPFTAAESFGAVSAGRAETRTNSSTPRVDTGISLRRRHMTSHMETPGNCQTCWKTQWSGPNQRVCA